MTQPVSWAAGVSSTSPQETAKTLCMISFSVLRFRSFSFVYSLCLQAQDTAGFATLHILQGSGYLSSTQMVQTHSSLGQEYSGRRAWPQSLACTSEHSQIRMGMLGCAFLGPIYLFWMESLTPWVLVNAGIGGCRFHVALALYWQWRPLLWVLRQVLCSPDWP